MSMMWARGFCSDMTYWAQYVGYRRPCATAQSGDSPVAERDFVACMLPNTFSSQQPMALQVLRAAVAKFFPAANSEMKHACVCMFTNTPDSHFIIDRHPEHAQVATLLLSFACLILQPDVS